MIERVFFSVNGLKRELVPSRSGEIGNHGSRLRS
jgi:hypothetical protein